VSIKKVGLTLLILVAVLFIILNAIVASDYYKVKYTDKIDFPFVEDKEVIGRWEKVGFIHPKLEFDPQNPKMGNQEKGYIEFYEGGQLDRKRLDESKLQKLISNIIILDDLWKWNVLWTKGLVVDTFFRSASRYTIKEKDGAIYLFLQHKEGNYSIYGQKDENVFLIVYKKVD